MATAKKPKTKKKTELIVNEDTDAKVLETIDEKGKSTKRVTYDAKIKESEEFDDDEDADFLGDNEDFLPFENSQENFIPKPKLDKMFDELELLFDDSPNEVFYARIIRNPDGMQRFNFSATTEMDLGVCQFTLQNRFNFIELLQERNNNSGGFFNILVYDSNQKPVVMPHPYRMRESKPVGVKNLFVPNPVIKAEPQQNNENLSVIELMRMLDDKAREREERQNERFERMFEKATAKHEPSDIEKMLMQATINNLNNPKENTSIQETLTSTLIPIITAPALMNKLIDQSMPKEQLPPQKNLLESAKELMDTQVAGELTAGVVDILEKIAMAKANQPLPVNPQPQENPQQINNNTMSENQQETNQQTINNNDAILAMIVNELDSENELNAENETIQFLVQHYPQQVEELQAVCLEAPFTIALNLLTSRIIRHKPELLAPYINTEKMQEKNSKTIIWNEKGEHFKARLKEFHTFINELAEQQQSE